MVEGTGVNKRDPGTITIKNVREAKLRKETNKTDIENKIPPSRTFIFFPPDFLALLLCTLTGQRSLSRNEENFTKRHKNILQSDKD